ncbi:hypothetical protein EMIT0158MI4_60324 [Burkholderia ambifaria]
MFHIVKNRGGPCIDGGRCDAGGMNGWGELRAMGRGERGQRVRSTGQLARMQWGRSGVDR